MGDAAESPDLWHRCPPEITLLESSIANFDWFAFAGDIDPGNSYVCRGMYQFERCPGQPAVFP